MGFENALSEITLVLFTTLAPSGVLACQIIGAVLLFAHPSDDCHRRLSKFLCIPVLVALVGLVASATHLGNPGNALYVLSGVGRSPLSNEVFAGVVFFGLVGSYWFYSFSETRRPTLERLWIVLFLLAGVGFLAGVALAYNVNTIITWYSPLVPLGLVLNALVGGPLLALCVFAAADKDFAGDGDAPLNRRVAYASVAVSGAAAAANAIVYATQGMMMESLSNSLVSFIRLVPMYPAAVGAFAVLCAAAIVVDVFMLRRSRRLSVSVASLAALLALMGIFAMRFTFYMSHMTVGVSL